MMWLNGANLVLAPVVPLLLGAPKYLAGDMTLGSLMQAATAFVQVQLALNWLADNALRLADWFASSHRVTQLSDAIDRLEESLGRVGERETIKLGVSPDNRVHLRRLSIALHDGTLMIDGAGITISPGEKVLVKGELGSGKSTLIHAMAGLWPWGSGEILRPEGATMAFMPQRPYFPLGTLRTALLYPHAEQEVPDEKIRDILMRCGLEHLIPRIDETDEWSSLLSGGEQQRLAFGRILIHPPDILIMDEPTSWLDELSQFRMMEYMRDLLPDTMVIHAARRPGLESFHDREIQLVRETHVAPSAARDREVSRLEALARAFKRWERGRSN
jgi:putative ATP-binding cassette transporter